MTKPRILPRGKSAQSLLKDVRDLVSSAHLSEAAGLLDRAAKSGHLPDEAVLLRGRLYLKTKDANPNEAITYLTRSVPKLQSGLGKAEANIVLGASHARVGDHRSARSRFTLAARELTAESPQANQLRVELAYQLAVSLWMQRKLDEADRELKPALEARELPSYIDALALKAAIYYARGRFENQASTLLEALRVVLSSEIRDVYRWGHVVLQLSILSRELPNQSIRNAAFEQVDKVPWTEDLAEAKFIAVKAVGWRRGLEGDYFNAFRYLKQAAECAHTLPWQVVASCDRAYLAASLGEARWSEQELQQAAELADRVSWRAIDGEERVALLLLAELYAPLDGALALSYVTRFQETGDRFKAVLSTNADPRVEGLVAYSLGYVREHLGDLDEATELYQKAFEIYDKIGYDWRAGRAAMSLAQVTTNSTWLDIAAKKLRPYPLSWLATRLRSLASPQTHDLKETAGTETERRAAQELTPSQNEVYKLLLSGAPTRDIAHGLGRSEF